MKLKQSLMLAPLFILMTACAMIPKTATNDVICTGFSLMTYDSKKDTSETVLEIRQYNAKWHSLCK